MTATGTGLTYQWQESTGGPFANLSNGGVYSGVTSSTLILTGVMAAMTGNQYQVVVTGTCSPTTSAAGTLTVNTLPLVTSNPADVAVCEGTGTSFSVTATGTGITYQWQEDSGAGFVNLSNGGVYSNVTTPTMSISDVVGLGGNRYRAVVSGTCSPAATSTSATLTEQKDPIVTVSPANAVICEGNNTTFSVTATGTGITYQWQESTGGPFVNLSNGGVYSGVTTSTLSLTGVMAAMTGNQYQVVVTGTCSPTTSAAGTLTVNTLPLVTSNPADVAVCEGTGTSFSVTATGTGITYQWQESTGGPFVNLSNGGVYSNVTTPTMSISDVVGLGGNRYRAVVSGTCSPAATSTSATLTEQKDPIVTVSPANAVICEGNNTTFSVTATGTGITYQWQESTGGPFVNLSNGGVYSGVTTSTLSLTGVMAAMTGNQYQVVVTGTCSPTTSAAGTLTVNTLPLVTSNPADVAVCEGTGTSFSVTATGTGITYQWQESTGGPFVNLSNGGVYSNVTTPTMSISDVVGLGGNRYRAVVSGTCSPAATSTSATLTEQKDPIVTVAPANAVICEGNNTTFSVTATGTGLTYQWQESTGGPFANLSNGGVYSGVTSSTLILTGVTATMTGNQYQVVVTGTCSPTTSAAGTLTVNTLPLVTSNPADVAVCEGTGTSFSVTATGTGITYQWQESTGGPFVNLSNGGVYSNVTTPTMSISDVVGLGGNRYRAVVSGTCSPAATSTSATLTEQKDPIVTVSPANAVICEGNNTTFSVTATGTGITYQWQESTGGPFVNLSNGGVYSGVTTSTLSLTGVMAAMTGNQYQVVVTGTCSPTTSAAGTLTVNTLPLVTSNPADVAVCEGTGTSFSVTATGTGITYQWQEDSGAGFVNLSNGGVYSNVTTPTMSISDVVGLGGNRYRAVVSGTCSPAATSTSATLTEQKDPIVTVAPANAVICEGNNTTFSVTATGTGLTYQWQESTGGPFANLSNGGVYSGVTSSTLILTGVTATMTGNQYQVVVTGTCSPTTSAAGTLTVNTLPLVTSNPADAVVCEGSGTSFTVAATGTGITYQWQESTGGPFVNLSNGGVYSNVTTPTMSISDVVGLGGNRYRAVVSGTCSPAATSTSATLTEQKDPIVTVSPANAVICEGNNTTFSVTATGTGITYQWQESTGGPFVNLSNGGVYSGVTTSTLSLTGVMAAMTGNQYQVVVTGTCSPTTSAAGTLTVNTLPLVTSNPADVAVCEGTGTSFSVTATGTGITYQWQEDSGAGFVNLSNGGVYSNVTTPTMSISDVVGLGGNRYRAVVSGTCSPASTSTAATLTEQKDPIVTVSPANAVICEGNNTTFSVTATGTGLTYQWQESTGGPFVNLSNGGVYSGVTTSTLSLTGVMAAMTGYQYQAVVTGTCSPITSAAGTLTVNLVPDASAADASICSGQTTNIAITNPNLVPGTAFTWTVQSASNVSNASPGAGNLIAQTLTSTDGINPGTVTYLIQPSAAGCNGAPYAVSVIVTPIPDVAASPQTICSGTSTSVAITNPNGVFGTNFSWSVLSTSNVTGAIAGSGTVISQVLTSSDGINPGSVTYRITPSANGCAGSSIDVVVTVSPEPVVTNTSPSLIQEICSGTSLNFMPTSSIGGTTFNWTSFVIGTLTGVTASGSGPILDTPVNSTNSSAVIIYNIVPVIGGCTGAAVNFVVTVRPVPTALASDQTICSGQTTSINITNPNLVSGTTYTWTVSGTNTTGASAGAGNTISQLLTSTDGLTNGTVTYTITPSANGCPGPTFDVMVTVDPVPVMTNTPPSLSQQICSTESLNFIPTATIGGTTYAWTSTIVGPIVPGSVTASGSGPIVDAPQNSGNVSGTVTYRITPSFSGCSGLPVDLVVTVKPLPSATAPDITICSGEDAVINILPTPQNVAGTTFAWIAVPSANISGAANGNGSIINQQLFTTNAVVGTVVYNITPTANACDGPISPITVTVNPAASVFAGLDFAVCEPASFPISGFIGGSATTATWTNISGAGTISATTVVGSIATAIYTVDPTDITQVISFVLTSDDPDGVGPCKSARDDLDVTINRQARLTLPPDYTVCEPTSIDLSGTLSGSATSGLWSLVSGAGTLSATSVTGLTVTASYDVVAADVTNTLRFRLTTNDPDGFGPCVAEFDEIDILVNESAKIFAGADFEVCEDQVINLAATAGGATSTVLWSGGSGAPQFSSVNNVNSTYTLTPADIAAGGVTLTITTNDPDGAGPCTAASDQIFIKINKLPAVFLSGLDPVYAENSGLVNLDGFPLGGTFTGPGILAGTNIFNPATAGFGIVVIRYTYTDPSSSCTNFTERSTIVNPVTSVDFYVLEDNRPNASGFPQICANQNELTLIGIPPVSDGFDPTKFRPISPELLTRITFDGTNWKISTNGLPAGTYQLQYIFTNMFNATDTLTKDLIVFSAPQAVIDVGNNCIEDVVTFTESSNIPNNLSGGTIIGWNWFFDEASNGSNGPVPEPQYSYLNPGTKNISLEVLTDQGCRNKAFKTIVIGKLPLPDFTWSSYCKGDSTRFKDASGSEFGLVDTYTWDFGDGQSDVVMNPVHQYATYGVYDVNLTVSTDAGCSSDTTKQVYIQDLKTPLRNAGYSIDFENGPETWVNVADGASVNNSWIFGTPTGDVINSANSGANAWWTGANADSYFNNEKSFVIGPCLNLSDLKRPMISIKYWVDAQDGFDGAVVQYSTNGGDTWSTVGDAEGGGIEWYNSRNLSGQPGGQSNFAWSGSDNTVSWRDGRYNLDQIPLALRDTVIFRIAFGSNGDNPSGGVLNGFAFDDIYIGEKNRNVLVEHFTNVNSTPSNQANVYLENLYRNQITKKDSSDFIPIQYHVTNPGFDQLNADNPQDPIARALLYGVSQPPTTIMDGIQDNYFNGFIATISDEELDRRALEDAPFDIQIDTIAGPGTNDLIRLVVTFTYVDSLKPLNTPVTFHAALLERGVSGAGGGNVVRKLLLQSEGRTVTRSWAKGDTEIANIQYAIDVPIVNSDSLFILAFVQEKDQVLDSRRILQTAIVKSGRKKGITVVGLPDDPITGDLADLSIYPNPASNVLNITVGGNLPRQYNWAMIDQRGVTILSGELKQDFSSGPQRIDVSGVANGIYFMAIQTGDKSVVHRKIAVMNRN